MISSTDCAGSEAPEKSANPKTIRSLFSTTQTFQSAGSFARFSRLDPERHKSAHLFARPVQFVPRITMFRRQSHCDPIRFACYIIVDIRKSHAFEPRRGSWTEVSFIIPAINNNPPDDSYPESRRSTCCMRKRGMLTAPSMCSSAYSFCASTSTICPPCAFYLLDLLNSDSFNHRCSWNRKMGSDG